MGFYGNITNTARTQFQFDRVYPNRYSMELSMSTDGVYAGRYVLIEYDQNPGGTEFYQEIFREKSTNRFYLNYNSENEVEVLYPRDVKKDEIVRVYEEQRTDITKPDTRKIYFYKCINENSETEKIAIFELVSSADISYTQNYSIDLSKYGNASRGWDSTVWQKVYTQGIEKYVMIAELNTVVPSFDLVEDAPTMTPLTPHFDSESNNVYYKLHWQPQWGLRVAAPEKKKDSDSTTIWLREIYDPKTDNKIKQYYTNKNEWKKYDVFNEVLEDETSAIPAAIHYNQAAFSPQVNAERKSADGINKHVDGNDYFTILPTGKSGKTYNSHDGTGNPVEAEDIQEMRINLPAIGNMMSDAWDIIHGPYRNNARTDKNSSLQGRLDSFKEIKGNQIPVKRAADGTLVGSKINGALNYDSWDNKPNEILTDDGKSPGFNRDDAWIKTEINTSNLEGGIKEGDEIDQSNNSGISIHHTFHPTVSSTSSIDKNNGNIKKSEGYKKDYLATENLTASTNDKINLYVPYVDAAGHVVGKNIETVTLPYGFKTITTNGSNSSSVNDMKTATEDIVADNTQDTLAINSYNKWIKIANNASEDSITFAHEVNPIYMTSHGTTNSNTEPGAINENNINIPDWSYDAAGHITGKHDHYYTLPYGFKTIKSSNTEDNAVNAPATTIKTTGQIADKTQDTLNINASNRWIKIDNNTEDTIKLGHRLSNFEPGKANTLYGLAKDTSIVDLDADNTFEVPYFRFDEAGHIDFAETHTVTIPENFDKVAITLSDENSTDKWVGTTGTIEADTLTDTLTLTEGNRWINIDADATNDRVTFSHYVKYFNETSENIDFDNQNTFSVQEIVWDRAGHITGSHKKNYTLQDGFKQITVKNSGADIKTTATGQGASLIADNQVDNATIDTGNRWISLVGDANNDKFTIYHTFAGEVKENGSANLAKNNNTNPQFGGKFKVFTAGIDEAGHVNNLSDYEITLPKPSLNDLTATGSSVLTGISMKDESGAITQTNANVGTLALTDYNQGTDQGDLTASDSINSAFAKLQNQIHAEEKVRQEAITNEAAARANTDTTLTNNLNKEIENRQTAVQGEATARAKAITAEQQARAQAITQEVTDRNSAISTAIGNVTGGSTETIASLSEKLNTLQSQYNDLLKRVTALEANHPVEEEPTI